MERLTRLIYGAKGPNWAVANLEHDSQEIIDRLAAYEETGMTPEDVSAQFDLLKKYSEAAYGIGVKRLRELSQAEKDGRLVVLPDGKDSAALAATIDGADRIKF